MKRDFQNHYVLGTSGRWARSGKEDEAVIVLHIAKDLRYLILMLLLSLTWLVAIPIEVFALHIPKETLHVVTSLSQILGAVATVLLAFVST